MMSHTVDFYYDVISPFSHVALARMSELPGNIKIDPKPVLLGAILSHWGQLGPAEIAPKRLHTYRIATFLAKRYGVSLRFPPRHPFNPLAALRILAGANADMAMVRRAFDFVFGEGRAPDTADELAVFAGAIGAPLQLFEAQASKLKLRALTDEAIARGVFGVPTFAVKSPDGDQLFWGVDAFDMLLAYLEDNHLFSRPPYDALAAIEIGVKRK
jgi:2-hydroxychromene-2-carboxylate isomerase